MDLFGDIKIFKNIFELEKPKTKLAEKEFFEVFNIFNFGFLNLIINQYNEEKNTKNFKIKNMSGLLKGLFFSNDILKTVFSEKNIFKENNKNDEYLKIIVFKIPCLFSLKKYHIYTIFIGKNNTSYSKEVLLYICSKNIELIKEYSR